MSQHAVLPLQIYLRGAFIHIYVYPYIYLSDSAYPSLLAASAGQPSKAELMKRAKITKEEPEQKK
ncbi:MAG: hypothetical protein DMF30_07340 [Verrucomicrobia bacterium]|nr:MAG: hypothetical protein DMF30_07340 [Verrucomicrobiota bacterium]